VLKIDGVTVLTSTLNSVSQSVVLVEGLHDLEVVFTDSGGAAAIALTYV
jgi:hypothetical protein